MNGAPEQPLLLNEIADDFARRCRQGERPNIEECLARYPELAHAIQERFPSLEMAKPLETAHQGLLEKSAAAPEGQENSANSPSLPRAAEDAIPAPSGVYPGTARLGGFRIVRIIGRGGMGVVYEAVEESLGRRVAIKVLPRLSSGNDKRKQRFRREAQAAARLHHTNIVPVFGVGEQDDLQYIVMQFIPGRGLDRVLHEVSGNRSHVVLGNLWSTENVGGDKQDTPDMAFDVPVREDSPARLGSPELPRDRYHRAVARLMMQAADALGFAHRQGIVHRDIKPGNLLLDEQGTLWVTDFGIAKVVAEESLTNSGDVLGTMWYMAPERFRGESDGRGDIYSLGVTLYELLTLRLPFTANDPATLVHIVSHWAPPRPKSIDPTIPVDLETILLKAMARDPALRYQTADALADDLRRYLDDQPIRARRISPLSHGWRWCRRNPVLAGLTATVAILMSLTAGVSLFAWAHTEKARTQVSNANQRLRTALQAEKQQREHAENTAALALEALDRTYDELAPNRITVSPLLTLDGTSEETVEIPVQPLLARSTVPVLEKLLAVFEQIAMESAEFPSLRVKAARANHRAGDLRQRLGHYQAAIHAYERAIAMFEKLLDSTRSDLLALDEARCLNELGRTRALLHDRENSRREHEKALETLLELREERIVSQPAYRFELARARYFLEQDLGRFAPPRPTLPKTEPESRARDGMIRQTREELEQLVGAYPGVPDYRHLLACWCRDIRDSERRRDRSLGCDQYGHAVHLFRQLSKEFPNTADFRFELSATLANYALRHLGRRDPEQATKLLEEAVDISAKLAREFPTIAHYSAARVMHVHGLGIQLYSMRRLEDAEKRLREAATIQADLTMEGDASANTIAREMINVSLGRVLADRSQHANARATLEASIERLTRLTRLRQQAPAPAPAQWLLVRAHHTIADSCHRLGDERSAARHRQLADNLRRELVPPKTPSAAAQTH